MLNIETKTEIILHFNKMHLQDPTIPMWVIKAKGQTYYVDHVDVDAGIGFSTKETPDNPHTKGSLKFKGKINITTTEEGIAARIYP
jgi:hypothetical protein